MLESSTGLELQFSRLDIAANNESPNLTSVVIKGERVGCLDLYLHLDLLGSFRGDCLAARSHQS